MSSTTTTTSDGTRIVWGFMFENTLFTEFEHRNHPIIEAAYRQRKKKHSSHHITIVDSNLPKPGKAKVYFGVAQNHLRMPGTRYYVTRQLINLSSSSPFSLPMLIPSPTSTFSSSSFSSLDTSFMYHQTSKQKLPLQLSPQEYQQSSKQQQPFDQIKQMQQFNSNTLAAVLSDFTPLLELNYDFPSTNEYTLNDNLLYYDSNMISNPPLFIPDFNTLNVFEDPNWIDDILSLGPLNQVSWLSLVPAFNSSRVNSTYFHNLMTN